MGFETFGFRQVYGIDLGLSIMQYKEHSFQYQPSECFNNAFKCLGNNFKNYKENKAVIGYVLSTDGVRRIAVRHCWNIIDNFAVDVTMFANDEHPISVLNYSYLPVTEYSAEEFLNAIEKNNGFPALPKSKREYYFIKELKKKGFEVLE